MRRRTVLTILGGGLCAPALTAPLGAEDSAAGEVRIGERIVRQYGPDWTRALVAKTPRPLPGDHLDMVRRVADDFRSDRIVLVEGVGFSRTEAAAFAAAALGDSAR